MARQLDGAIPQPVQKMEIDGLLHFVAKQQGLAREGCACYGAGAFVQALLVRKLLWERVPSEQIAALMAGRSTEETKRMLFEGIEMVARQGGGGVAEESGEVEIWKRIVVASGIELHLRGDLPKPKPAEVRKLLALLEAALRKSLR